MAALGTSNPTLLDLARVLGPDHKVNRIVELLTQQNEILEDMVWQEGNMIDGHMTTVRTGLPQATWRMLNYGVQPTKALTKAVKDTTGRLENFAEVDKALADLNNNAPAFRLSQDAAFIEGMNQQMAQAVVYGNEVTNPAAFTGLAPRFNLSTALNGENIIKAGGASTNNASIFLIVWGTNTVHGIFPKGSEAGLQHIDHGIQVVEDASNGSNTGRMTVYRSQYIWNCGLTVMDWRYVVRVCNISKSALTADAASGANLPDLCYQALEQVPNLSMGKAAFYMSRNTRSFLRRQCTNGTKQSTLTIDNVGGKMLMAFQGVPLRRVDAMAADEALVA